MDELRVAKRKLQGLNNSVFEELSIDVYDEVDRRETDAIWNAVEGSGGKNAVIIPFLPVNPGVTTSSAIIHSFCFLNEITLLYETVLDTVPWYRILHIPGANTYLCLSYTDTRQLFWSRR